MIAAEDTVLVLLAAGKSARFDGARSKLDEPLGDRPLGAHAAAVLADVPFRARAAIVGRAGFDYRAHGFDVIANTDPVGDMASSLRLGVAFAQDHGAEAILVALADMPRITASHVRRLLDVANGHTAVVASASPGNTPRPPALFGRDLFAQLLTLTGDHGARDLIRTAHHVEAPATDLVDVDTRDDLAALHLSSSRP